MTRHYSVVVERESNGSFSAWVPGVPGVYAAADSAAVAKRAIRGALAAHLRATAAAGLEAPRAEADVMVLRYDGTARSASARLRFVGMGALLGRATSPAKAAASRRNGRKGGRPRTARTKPRTA